MLIQILITLVLVLLNGFFVAAEFAIVKIRASQLEQKAQNGNRFAILSKQIVSHLDGYLAGYFGEVDHLIPWQIDHLIIWRPVAEKSCRSSFKNS